MECRRLRNIKDRIELLGPHEHAELLAMITDSGVRCVQNTNGYFCDLAAMPAELVERMARFVEFSVCNNLALEKYDKDVHEQVQLLQRLPPPECPTAAKAAAVRRAAAPRRPEPVVARAAAPKASAYLKRASTVARKRVAPEPGLQAEGRVVVARKSGGPVQG